MDFGDSAYQDQCIVQNPEAEQKSFQNVVNTFRFYKSSSLRRLTKRLTQFARMPDRQKDLVPDYMNYLKNIRVCMEHNAEVLKVFVDDAEGLFENATYSDDKSNVSVSEFQMDKLHSTLKQLVRDWSSAGSLERTQCYSAIIAAVCENFLDCPPEQVKILTPGCGLGRLTFEFAKMGFESQGNEFSYHMLLASNFILNRCKESNIFTIYPYVHQFSNNMSQADHLAPVTFPDINPSELPEFARFSMSAGDFEDVYGSQFREWDVVATVFFVDTAHNILNYIQLIYQLLKPGGIWVNHGPLLYHFAEHVHEDSLELPYELVRTAIEKVGFVIEKEETKRSSYTQNPKSMLNYEYECIFTICRKPIVE